MTKSTGNLCLAIVCMMMMAASASAHQRYHGPNVLGGNHFSFGYSAPIIHNYGHHYRPDYRRYYRPRLGHHFRGHPYRNYGRSGYHDRRHGRAYFGPRYKPYFRHHGFSHRRPSFFFRYHH